MLVIATSLSFSVDLTSTWRRVLSRKTHERLLSEEKSEVSISLHLLRKKVAVLREVRALQSSSIDSFDLHATHQATK